MNRISQTPDLTITPGGRENYDPRELSGGQQQRVGIALTKTDTRRGLVAGFAIALIAIMAERVISAIAQKAKARYGLTKIN